MPSTSYGSFGVLGSSYGRGLAWDGGESWRIVSEKLATNEKEGDTTIGIEYLLSTILPLK